MAGSSLLLGIISVILGEIYGIFNICVGVILFIIIFANIYERYQLLIEIKRLAEDLIKIREESSPNYDSTRIVVDDYLDDLRKSGFSIELSKNKDNYKCDIKKGNDIFQIRIISNLFFYSCSCRINGKKFEYMNEKMQDLKLFVSNYRICDLHKDLYGKLECFVNYLILK